MPWNRSASIRGSSVPRSMLRAGTAVGGSTSGLSASRRLHAGSRLVSASPLQGRGLGVRGSYGRGFSDLGLPGDEEMLGTDLPDFDETELYGIETEAVPPAAHMGSGPATAGAAATATVVRPQVHRFSQAHLDREAFNFLAFVEDGISSQGEGGERGVLGVSGVPEGGRGGTEEEEAGTDINAAATTSTSTRTITLETLLPPHENSATVAAQGLLHTLTLASRNVLRVWQREPFGEIRMGLIVGAEAGTER